MEESKTEVIQLETGLKVQVQTDTLIGSVSSRGEVIYVGSHHFRVRCRKVIYEEDLEPNQEMKITLANRKGMLPIVSRFIRVYDKDPRVLILKLPSGDWQQNRRAFYRGDMTTDVVVLRNNGTRAHGKTINLSGGGALVQIDSALKMGEEVQIVLKFATSDSIGTKARVVRVSELKDGEYYGVMFMDISTRDQNHICRLVLVDEFEARRAEIRELSNRTAD
ncbi:MAG: PilZ domain-containing protein [Deltaproteobacteria bacterium]|nr:PilZ domain-containing protein [Deltaproteobacteria bacterium]